MLGRTVILVSHHVQLCAPGASYIVSLDNGRLAFEGNSDEFKSSGMMANLVQSEQVGDMEGKDEAEVQAIEDLPSRAASSSASLELPADDTAPNSETDSTLAASSDADIKVPEKKAARKLIEEEKRAVGRIGKDIWKAYFSAVGGVLYWIIFILSILLAAASPVAENGWLRYAPRYLYSSTKSLKLL